MIAAGGTDEAELPEMSEINLSDAEEKNAQLVGFFDEGADTNMRAQLGNILDTYNQPNLLNFVVEVIVEALEDGEIRMEVYGAMIVYLKVIIDAMDN